jgi:hypothetical protein
MQKLRFILLGLLLISMLSCATQKPQVVGDVQEGYVVIRKDALADLMRSAELCKQQLTDCLQHQKEMQK